jgi:hypothetical protein
MEEKQGRGSAQIWEKHCEIINTSRNKIWFLNLFFVPKYFLRNNRHHFRLQIYHVVVKL